MSAEQNVKRQYERLRVKSEAALESCYAQVQEVPGVPELQSEIGKLTSAFFSCAAHDPARPGMLQELSRLNAAMRDALECAGLGAGYLEPRFECTACRDTGYLPGRRRCACFEKKLAEEYAREWGMADTGASFACFDLTLFPDPAVRAHREKLLAHCRAYAKSFPRTQRPNMLFIGKAGLGKTYLMECVCRAVSENGFGVIRVTAYRLLEVLMQKGFGEERAALMAELIACPLLFIDDLGSEPLYNNMTIEVFFNLINERGTRNKHTLFCTNLRFEHVQQRYGDRVASRLFDSRHTLISLFEGRDLRLT